MWEYLLFLFLESYETLKYSVCVYVWYVVCGVCKTLSFVKSRWYM